MKQYCLLCYSENIRETEKIQVAYLEVYKKMLDLTGNVEEIDKT